MKTGKELFGIVNITSFCKVCFETNVIPNRYIIRLYFYHQENVRFMLVFDAFLYILAHSFIDGEIVLCNVLGKSCILKLNLSSKFT